MLVEQPASDQFALHLPKLLPDLTALGRGCPTFFQLDLGELPMTKVRRRDPHSTLFGLCAIAGPAMKSALAIRLIGRTLTRRAPTCLRTAPLPRQVRPEPPLDTDGHVVFCQHQ